MNKGPSYQLPHYLYFIDNFSEDDCLVKMAFVLKLEYDHENDKYFDVNQSYYTIPEKNMDDFIIGINLIKKKHAFDLGDVIGHVYEENIGERAAKIRARYMREHEKQYSVLAQEYYETHEVYDDVKEHLRIREELIARLGVSPAVRVKDLPVFLPYISLVMQLQSLNRLHYFCHNWERYFVKDNKKINCYLPALHVQEELQKLEEVLDPLDSF